MFLAYSPLAQCVCLHYYSINYFYVASRKIPVQIASKSLCLHIVWMREVKSPVKRGTFHGRVILADRSFLLTLFLASCFFFGALLGNRVAGMEEVYSSAELQDFLSSFLTLVRSGQLEPASFGAALFSYFKYPIVVFGLSFLTIGIFFIPIVTFYQGFMFSFAVSAFLYAAGEHGLVLALLLFGLRCIVVLPCYFWLASSGMALAVGPGTGNKTRLGSERAGSDTVWRFIFCSLILFAGAAFEHLVLAGVLSAVC